MLTKRIIPCLDIKDGRTVKGVNFEGLRDAGDPIELAKRYVSQGADELVFLDITATIDKRKTLLDLVEKVAREINIPFTVGGGISTVVDVVNILKAGADKVSINSAAVKNPQLITDIALKYGAQCVVLAIDARKEQGEWVVYTGGGRNRTELNLFQWAQKVEQLGAGEILFTSMNADGTKKGFEIQALEELSQKVNIPIIASGGAGSIQDFVNLFLRSNVDAALAASVFHYGEIQITELKKTMSINQIPTRL